MTTKTMQKRGNKGFTLTEIAIVLGIIGLILGAIWTAASSVYANQRTAHAQTAVLQIAQGVRSLYASQSSTGYSASTDITAQLTSAGVIPSDLNGGQNGPFPNGATGVLATQDGLGFVIVMTAVPQANCINLLAAIGGNNRDPGLFSDSAVTSAAIATSDATTTGTVLSTAVTPKDAAAAIAGSAPSQFGGCSTSSSTLNKVRFGFTLR